MIEVQAPVGEACMMTAEKARSQISTLRKHKHPAPK